ncbi:LysR family transcriptional regulator [Acuticoccus mangrovi]|uniref:LysR family transcriptional regulator n=1 Tax=Acuticoccus mangrovi TaxID=2796142 RepID=A0A934IFM0_9HYPH|nr:LysR family transcriptional regulator [Acuticoccus mangrovi]MBJ3775759.1 LysR family transcriptional regulator [Acuticoccus mangrovi]
MTVTLRALRYLVATADCGNITEAARMLNISQPSVSAAVAQLEHEFSVSIFVRHHARGVTPTPAGLRIIGEARLLLKHAADFERDARSLGEELSGEISIGCFVTLAARFMPALFTDFRHKYPGITLTIREGNQDEIIGLLRSGRIEFALSYAYALPDDITRFPLADLRPYVLLSADHPLAGQPAIELAALADEPFLLLDLPHTRDYFLSLFATAGVEPKVALRSQSADLIRGLVGHRQGYTLHNAVPKTDASVDGGRIATIPIAGSPEPVRIVGLALGRQVSRPAMEAFSRYLRSAFSPGGIFAPGSLTPTSPALLSGSDQPVSSTETTAVGEAGKVEAGKGEPGLG